MKSAITMSRRITSSWINRDATPLICRVTYDGRTSAGQVTAPFPQGDVLGTAQGRFSVYVVSPHSAPLEVDLPEHDFLTAPADFTVTATSPTGMRLTGGHMTALIPGVVSGRWLADRGGQQPDL